MRSRYWPIALMLGLWVGMLAVPPVPADDKPDAAKIQKLIDQMGSDKFEDREAAVKALDAVGEPALELLRKAVKDGEPEVSKRANELVKKIEKTTERSRVLGATKVKLVFKDTPVADAVAEIQKKTGYNLLLHDPEGKLKDRKVTLDTGETTFWNAFEQFCQKAGLAEATPQEMMMRPLPGNPVPVKPLPAPAEKAPPKKDGAKQPAEKKDQAAQRAKVAEIETAVAIAADKAVAQVAPPPPPALGGGAIMLQQAIAQPFFPGQPGQITLIDGKDKELKEAADVASAVRVKALAKSDMFGNAQTGEYQLVLQISPEPKLQWQQTIAVRVTKVLDDQGQELKDLAAENPGAGGPGFPGGVPGGLPPGAMMKPAMRLGFGGMHQYAPVRLKKGEKAAKSLKELSGTVTAQLLTAPQALITAENVLKNNGKTFKGAEEGSIKILDVSKGENGLVTIRYELEQPANVIPANGGGFGFPGGMGGIQFQPVPLPAPAVPAAPPAKEERVKPKGALNAAPAAAQQVQVVEVQGKLGVNAFQVQVQPAFGIAMAGPGMEMNQVGYNGVGMLDEKNKPVPIIVQQQIGWKAFQPGQKNVQEHIFVFQLEKGQSDNVKLVFLSRKQTTIDIPFTIKDVPLP